MAIPAYQRAILKARAIRVLPLMRAISNAQNAFLMEHGRYSNSFASLSVDLPQGAKVINSSRLDTNDFSCFFYKPDGRAASVYCNDKRTQTVQMEKYFARQTFICWGNNSEQAMVICQDISGKETPDARNGGAKFSTGYSF